MDPNNRFQDQFQEDSDNVYTWIAIVEICVFLLVLSKNVQRIHSVNKQIQTARDKDQTLKRVKLRFLQYLAIAIIARVISLLCLLTGPSGIFLYMMYILPIQMWIPSIFSFMGFLGLLYFQLKKKNAYFLRTLLDWCGIFLGILIILFLFDSFFDQTYETAVYNLLKVDMICYSIIQFGNLFFGYNLYRMLQDDSQIFALLNEFKKIVLTISGLFVVRLLFFFLISFEYMTLQNDKLLLMEMFSSEMVPFIYLISTKLQLQQYKYEHEEVNDTVIEMKDISQIKENLLGQ